jgi:thiol-disulfide isomerase/thioredoxin
VVKRVLGTLVTGVLGGGLACGAYIIFFLQGGLHAYLEKRTDFKQLYQYDVGEKFIDINYRDLDGKSILLSQYPHDVTLINFFVSSSGSSDAEAPRLERLSEKYRERGLLVVAIDVNESRNAALAFRQKHHLNFPVVMVAERVEGGSVIPFNLIIDQKGVVRFSGSGDRPNDIENVIDDLLRGAPANKNGL